MIILAAAHKRASQLVEAGSTLLDREAAGLFQGPSAWARTPFVIIYVGWDIFFSFLPGVSDFPFWDLFYLFVLFWGFLQSHGLL